jgi:N-acetylglucosamine kinase-like BadF-type ATPase
MTRDFLGVDIGNTKSHALIADESGTVLGMGIAGCGSHEVIGADGFRAVLHGIVADALADAGLSAADIAGAGFGIAGYDWPGDRPLMIDVIDGLGLSARYEVVNDGVVGLIAGAKRGWGVVVSAGTSCSCRGRDQRGREGRVAGTMFAGEYGGGHELVERALASVARAWSKRGPETQLTQVFLEHFGAKSVEELLEGMARGRYRLLATDAPLVFETAQRGDTVAREAIIWIAEGLADLAIGVIHQLGFEDQTFEVVMSGSIYKGSSLVEETLRAVIQRTAPKAEFVRLNAPPVVGAVMLGMEVVGVDFTQVRERLIATANQHLDARQPAQSYAIPIKLDDNAQPRVESPQD